MSRRLITEALAVIAFLSVVGASHGTRVRADPGDGLGSTDAQSNATSGEIAVAAERTEEGGRQAARSAPSRPVCSYEQWAPPPDV